jgi:peptidoglycan hydrolase-like protein with peptidoglycan-binding domain
MTTTSYNGWPASRDPDAIGIDYFFAVGGVQFPGGVKGGDVAAVLGHVLAGIHLKVERLVKGWCWGYEYRQNVNDPSTLSCHSSGTAVDVNAPRHPNGVQLTWSPEQVAQIRELIAQVGGVVAWGHDWRGTVDDMHFEIRGSAAAVKTAAAGLRPSPPAAAGPSRYPLSAGYYFGPLSGPKESISGMAPDGSDRIWRPSISSIQRVVGVAADGLYGPRTIQAVKGWQAAHHLEADGLTGPLTWRAMRL